MYEKYRSKENFTIMNKKTIRDIDVKGKKVLVRCDFNVPMKDGVITVYINGVYQNTGTNKVKEGHIGLQSEGKEVEFRNVTLTKW